MSVTVPDNYRHYALPIIDFCIYQRFLVFRVYFYYQMCENVPRNSTATKRSLSTEKLTCIGNGKDFPMSYNAVSQSIASPQAISAFSIFSCQLLSKISHLSQNQAYIDLTAARWSHIHLEIMTLTECGVAINVLGIFVLCNRYYLHITASETCRIFLKLYCFMFLRLKGTNDSN